MDRSEELSNSLLRQLPSYDDRAGDLESAMLNDPFERAAYRVRQAARPTGGRREGAMSEALSDPAFLFKASPLGVARDAMTAANEGDYGRAAATAAPLAVPFAGPLARGAGAVLRAAPRAAAAGAGAAAALAPTATEEVRAAEPGSSSDWWRTPREPFAHPEFVPPTLTADERDQFTQPEFVAPEQPPRPNLEGLGPMARKETQARYDTRLERAQAAAEDARKEYAARQAKMDDAATRFLENKTDKARQDWERARDAALEAHAAEQARLDQRDIAYKLQNQSFRESHPNLTLAAPAIGAGIAGAIPYGGRMAARRVNNTMADQLFEAVGRARGAIGSDAATRAAARGEMKAGLGPSGVGRMVNEAPGTGTSLASLGTGALSSAEAGLIPYEIDMATLPEGSHGRQEAENYRNWLQRGGFSSLGGLLAASYGLKAPLAGQKLVPPTAEMEGLLSGLVTPRAPKASAQKAPAPPRKRRLIAVSNEE